MKKLFLMTIFVLLFLTALRPAPVFGTMYRYRAMIHVYDHADNPKSNIQMQLYVCAASGFGFTDLIEGTAMGYTNASGFVDLSVYLESPYLVYMEASVVYNPPYSTIKAINNFTQTSSTIYPEFWVVIDNDEDLIADVQEQEIAEKFKPVLHKHSYDKSQGLANFEQLLINGKFRLKVYNDIGQELYNQVVSGLPNALHKWETWHWDTYGWGSASHGVYSLDLADALRYASAPVGQRPVYYHVYKDGSYYYVQYWYYFGMDNITEQVDDMWHESDWEHITIRLIKSGDTFIPDKINFYVHEGGLTWSADDCWWSPSNTTTYSSIQQGYDENHTHLHIWLAANTHASYNRYSYVYHQYVNILITTKMVYKDRLDYEPSGYDLYFPYDQLIKLGEITKETYVRCPDSGYKLEYHCYPIGPISKHWLAYIGRLGNYGGIVGARKKSPFMPAKEAGDSHEFWGFSIGAPYLGFGNDTDSYLVAGSWTEWHPDDNIGD